MVSGIAAGRDRGHITTPLKSKQRPAQKKVPNPLN